MHVVQVYHNQVPVAHYGGMERVIVALCQGLLELGHKVSLISYKGCTRIPGVSHRDLDIFSNMEEAERRYIELIPSDADVLHFHLPHMVKSAPLKSVVTMHGNLRQDEDPNTLPASTIFLCRDHAHRHCRERFVFNGLNPKEIPFSSSPLIERTYLAFLGRASLKRKGLHHAQFIARKLKLPLHVGGGRGLPWPGRKFLGQLDDLEKYRLLAGAQALLFPIEWDEPFGLVMIEAMFCGTTVYAFSRGSVSEVLDQPGSNGLFIQATQREQLLSSIQSRPNFPDPNAIRAYAEKYFTHTKMVEGYLPYYQA